MAVHVPEQWMYTEERTLEPFRVSQVEDPYHLWFRLVETLSPPDCELTASFDEFLIYVRQDTEIRYFGTSQGDWEKSFVRVERQGKTYHVQLKAGEHLTGVSAKTVMNSMAAEHTVIPAGGVVFHSSYIDYKGQGILFTAPSGTGKSTQADLWNRLRGAEIINGDRSVIRVVEEGVVVSGIPFAGSSSYCKNRTLPLKAIVYLEQAAQTTVRQVRGVEAFRRVWEGVSVNIWNKEDVTQASGTVQQIVQHVPVYYLACAPDESAVTAVEQMLRK